MANLVPKAERGDVLGQAQYRASRLAARLERLSVVMARAQENKNDKLLSLFTEEKEMREAELGFLSKKIARLEADAA